MHRTRSALLVLVFVVFAVPAAVRAQPAQPTPGAPAVRTPLGAPFAHAAAPGRVQVRDEAFESEALGRSLKYRVILPADYEFSGRRYPVLYLLHGLTGAYGDWEGRTNLAQHLRGWSLIVVMPDGGNSWYVDSAEQPQHKFETAIGSELITEVDARFRTIDARYARAIAGLSMGGYGALKFGLKFPGRFVLAGGFSGALQAAREADFLKRSPQMKAEFDAIFGGPGSKTRAANEIFDIAAKADPARMPYFYLDCGTEDTLLAVNREFVNVLKQRGIKYEYHEVPGAHTWDYWDRQIPMLLGVVGSKIPFAREMAPVRP